MARISQLAGWFSVGFGLQCLMFALHKAGLFGSIVYWAFIIITSFTVLSLLSIPGRRAAAKLGNVTPESVALVGLAIAFGSLFGLLAGV